MSDDLAAVQTCLGVVSAGALCPAPPLLGQVYCASHLQLEQRRRAESEAALESARTDVQLLAAQKLHTMLLTLTDLAESGAVEPADRIRAASRVLQIGGALKVERGTTVTVQQTNVNAAAVGEISDTDNRLLALIEKLGPEGAQRAALLRGVIETGEHGADPAA